LAGWNYKVKSVSHPTEPANYTGSYTRVRKRIVDTGLLKNGKITDPKECEILHYLLHTKKWNPYCIRDSAITYDSDSLPEFALKRRYDGQWIQSNLVSGLK
jgi:hypothetical protein